MRILGTEYGRANLLKLADKWLNESDYKVLVGITLLSDSRDIEMKYVGTFFITVIIIGKTLNILSLLQGSGLMIIILNNKIERNFIDFEFSCHKQLV